MRKLKNILEPFLILLCALWFSIVMLFPVILVAFLGNYWWLVLYAVYIIVSFIIFYDSEGIPK